MISGFRASDIGQYGIEDLSWWEPSGGFSPSPFDVGGGESPFWDIPFDDLFPTIIASVGGYTPPSASVFAFPSGASIPQVRSQPSEAEEILRLPEDLEDEAVAPTPTGPRSVVPSVLDVDWKNDIPETGIGVFTEEPAVAIDWGTLAGTVLSSYVGARYAPSPVRGIVAGPAAVAAQPSQSGFINQYTAPAAPGVVMAQDGSCSTCPTGSPRYSKICNATGEITPLRRRRRKRLFTSGDLSDIAALKALVGGGAALNAAVVKAMK